MKFLGLLVLFYLIAALILQSWQTAFLVLLGMVFLGVLIALLVYSWQYMKEKDNLKEKEKWDESP